MAKKNNNGVQGVSIVESRLAMWGTAENRARLLVQELVKLNEFDAADVAKRLLNHCRAGFDVTYDEYKAIGPAQG